MSKEPEARIINRQRSDGKVEISMYDPSTGRECRTGLTTSTPQETEQQNQKLAKQFRQAGNRVGFKQI